MTGTVDNLRIIEILRRRGFSETTSSGRSTKSKRFKHPGMVHHVSVKIPDDPGQQTTTYPLVIESAQWKTLFARLKRPMEINVSPKPAQSGSLKYAGEPGVALGFGSEASLHMLLDAALGAYEHQRGSPPAPEPEPEPEPRSDSEPPIPNTLEARAAAAEVASDPSSAGLDETTRQRLVNARLGQGGYRREMLKLWDGRCALTACAIPQVLIASHAKPWAGSTNDERLDPHNGLLLAASVDRLFDSGLISFDDDGRLLRHASIGEVELDAIGLKPSARLRKVHFENRPYLAAHRARHGF